MERTYKSSEAQRRASTKWQAQNPERTFLIQSDWSKANRDKRNSSLRKCRARQKIVKEGFLELVAMVECF